MQHLLVVPRAPRRPWHALARIVVVIVVVVAMGAAGCNTGTVGACGPVLSAGECEIARVQIGALAPAPPPDPTNRYGQGTPFGTDTASVNEQNAYELGRRLFFDHCLSQDKRMACVTCHDPGAAFIDSRARELAVPVSVTSGMTTTTVLLPPVQDNSGQHLPLSPALATTPPPAVAPQLDLTGQPLAYWDATGMQWHGVTRRPQASQASEAAAYGQRNAPMLYNVAYASAVQPSDGARTYGATWGPWDGRYDSLWSLSADVYEFGGTNRTNRAHLALRIYRQFRALYEQTFGGPMPDLDAVDGGGDRIYPTNASPNGVVTGWKTCWNSTSTSDLCPGGTNAPTAQVKSDIDRIFVNAGKALAAYLRRLRSGNSPFDIWLQDPNHPAAMSVAAQRGLQLFLGKAECILCHNGPNFTDWRFHNLGVPSFDPELHIGGSAVPPTPIGGFNPLPGCFYPGAAPSAACPDVGHYAWQNKLADSCVSPANCQSTAPTSCLGSGGIYNDSGDPQQCLPPSLFDRCNIATQQACALDTACTWTGDGRCIPLPTPADQGAFKTPSLRNVGRTWPYMHNGALSDFGPAQQGQVDPSDPNADPTPHLTRVVQFYNQGAGTPVVGTRDPALRPLNLSPGEVADLVEFLKSLTDESVGAGEAGTDPDPTGDNPDPSTLNDQSTCPL